MPEDSALIKRLSVERIEFRTEVTEQMASVMKAISSFKYIYIVNPWYPDDQLEQLKASVPDVEVVRARYWLDAYAGMYIHASR